MTRTLVTVSLLAAGVVLALGTNEAEARWNRGRNRCCGSNAVRYNQGTTYTQSGWYGNQQTTTPVFTNNNGDNGGYASPTNVETRPKTPDTAPRSGPAPAGVTNPPAEAPQPAKL